MRPRSDHAPLPITPPPNTPHPVTPPAVPPPAGAVPTAGVLTHSPPRRVCRAINRRLVSLEGPIHAWLVHHSIAALRISLGLVFLAFGLLKYFPGVSPAAELAVTTTGLLTFGLVGDVVPAQVGLIMVATLECVIGLSLLSRVALRLTMYLLIIQLVGILSPVILLPGRLFAGPYHAPTLEGQYVLKDVVLVGAAMVVATTFRGARIRFPPPDEQSRPIAGR